MRTARLLALLLGAVAPAAAQDTAYRWVDAQGVTHFSDRPPGSGVEAVAVPIPDYEPPAGPAFSYVAMLQRLEALESELEATRRARQERPTPAPVVIQPVHTIERVATPVFFPRHHGFRPPRPDTPPRRTASDRFDRLVEGTRARYEPPRN